MSPQTSSSVDQASSPRSSALERMDVIELKGNKATSKSSVILAHAQRPGTRRSSSETRPNPRILSIMISADGRGRRSHDESSSCAEDDNREALQVSDERRPCFCIDNKSCFCEVISAGPVQPCKRQSITSQTSQLSDGNTDTTCALKRSQTLSNSSSSLYGRVPLEDYEHLEYPVGLGSSALSTHVEIAAVIEASVDVAALRSAHRRSNSHERDAVCGSSLSLSLTFATRRDTRSPLPLPPLPMHSPTPTQRRLPGLATEPPSDRVMHPCTGDVSCACSNSRAAGPSKFWRDLQELDAAGWYWGSLSRREAVTKLAGTPAGTFLVRDSSDHRHLFALSVRIFANEVRHYLIKHSCRGYSWYEKRSQTAVAWGLTPSSGAHAPRPSLVDLVNDTVAASRRSCCADCEVFLLHPLSRFAPVLSLQHIARFAVRRKSALALDNVDQLPIPALLKDYIRQSDIY